MGKTTAPVNPDTDASSPSPDQLRAEMARTRAEMAQTLDQLHGKLNPTVLKEQAIDQFHEAKEKVKAELLEDFETVKSKIRDEIREAKAAVRDATIGRVETMYHEAGDKVRETGHNVVDTIKSNPIPAALIGVGLTWLILGPRIQRKRSSFRDEPTLRGLGDGRGLGGGQELPYGDGTAYFDEENDELGTGVGDKVRGAARSVGEKFDAATGRVGEVASQAGTSIKSATTSAARTVGTAARDAGHAVGQFASRTKDGTVRVARRAAQQARQLEQRGVDVYQTNPLAVGVAAIAVGAAIGLMLPRTQKENEWLGSAGDQFRDKAEELAHGAIGKLEGAAGRLADRVSGEGEELEGGMNDGIGEGMGDTRH